MDNASPIGAAAASFTTVTRRFLTPEEVRDELAISAAQLYALIRRGDLQAVKVGGRGQWRIERDKLEDYIARLYAETREFIEEHPYPSDDDAGPSA